MPEKQYMVFVDTDRCVGCRTCEISCKQENDIPAGPQWIRLTEVEKEENGRVKLFILPMMCAHCGDPACAAVCPTGAVTKDPETGIVTVTQAKCIGCRMCMIVCPYGAPQFGKDGFMQKCVLCKDCVDRGEQPACARGCPAEAMFIRHRRRDLREAAPEGCHQALEIHAAEWNDGREALRKPFEFSSANDPDAR